jgi:micrococcal nuclease
VKGVLIALVTSVMTLGAVPALGADFVACHGRASRSACAYDGDTIWLEGVKIRAAGYDTPEMGRPLCSRRAAGATEARDALIELLNSGAVTIADTGMVSFDRVIAHVLVDGRDVGLPLIAAGLARPYVPGEVPWC